MKVAISIPVHEAPDVIADQCRNILGSTAEACVILHVSANAPDLVLDANGELADWIKDGRLIVNPLRLATSLNNVLATHVENFLHLESLDHPFEYFCLDASNSLLIRRDLDRFVMQFDLGLRYAEYELTSRDWHLPFVRKDDQLLGILKRLGDGNSKIIGSQVEGCFYRREQLSPAMHVIKRHYQDYSVAAYPKEEILLPTVFCKMNAPAGLRVIRPYVFIPWGRWPTLRKLVKTRSRRDYDVTVRDVEQLLAGSHPMCGVASAQVYGVKRVPRVMTSPVRMFIDQIMREPLASAATLSPANPGRAGQALGPS